MTRKTLALLLLAALVAMACLAWYSSRRAVAVVNGETITREDLARELELRFGPEVLQDLVSERLIAQAVEQYDVDVPAKEIDLWVADFRKRPEAQAMMAAGRLSEARLRRNLATAVPLYYLALQDVSEEDRKRFFRVNRDQFEELSLRHILLGSEEEASALRDRIRQPADFGAMAAVHSLDPRTRSLDGNLGATTRAELAGSFSAADVDRLFGLKVGEISQPLMASGGGWHLFLVEGRRVDYDSLRRRVVEVMAQQRIEPLRQSLRSNGKVEILLDLDDMLGQEPSPAATSGSQPAVPVSPTARPPAAPPADPPQPSEAVEGGGVQAPVPSPDASPADGAGSES